jgi:hydroxyacylglutathione hydrolase
MILETAAVAPFFKNGYVLACEATREGVFIDPGDEVDQLLAFIEHHRIGIRAILLTHAHVDHVSGVARAKQTLDVPIHLHRDDLFLYQQAVAHGRMFGLSITAPPPVDVFYDGKGPYGFGEYDVFVHHTPGHCPGGVCLQVGRRGSPGQDLFVGDTLFAGSIGRTDFPQGNHGDLIRSITERLWPMGNDTVFIPGHGPESSFGRERQSNPFVGGT